MSDDKNPRPTSGGHQMYGAASSVYDLAIKDLLVMDRLARGGPMPTTPLAGDALAHAYHNALNVVVLLREALLTRDGR